MLSMMSTSSLLVVAVASLAWFIVGLVAGRQISAAPARKRPGAGKGKPRDKAVKSGGQAELYVGNLSYTVQTKDLRQAFEKFGKVASARIIQNKFNGKSKGFGFVQMADKGGTHAAVKGLNGVDLKGRKLVVNEARERSRD